LTLGGRFSTTTGFLYFLFYSFSSMRVSSSRDLVRILSRLDVFNLSSLFCFTLEAKEKKSWIENSNHVENFFFSHIDHPPESAKLKRTQKAKPIFVFVFVIFCSLLAWFLKKTEDWHKKCFATEERGDERAYEALFPQPQMLSKFFLLTFIFQLHALLRLRVS